jgi:CspA family cold shock protein
MAQGRIDWYSAQIGYGFIVPDDGGERVFVHCSGIADDGNKFLENGERVTYEVVRGDQGMEAKNVSKA